MGVQGGKGVGDDRAAAVDVDADVDAPLLLLIPLLDPPAVPLVLVLADAPEYARAANEEIDASERLASVDKARRKSALIFFFFFFFFWFERIEKKF